MCRETKRKTPFNPVVLAEKEKLALQKGMFVRESITNHSANERGLAGWTDEHKQAWELERLNNPTIEGYNLTPVE